MNLEVFSLASGSSGNAMLVRGTHGDLLLDCGLSRAALEDALERTGGSPRSIQAIVLTHEHTDHARSAASVARRYKIPVLASAGTLDAALKGADCGRQVLLPRQPAELGEFVVTGYPVSHDAREPLAFAISCGSHRISYAVDVGTPGEALLEACRDAALVVIEANHDVNRLIYGPYAPYLKERILSQNGHLSNQEAAGIIAEVSAGPPVQFWLAHLSATNNTPRTALRTVQKTLRAAGHTHCTVDVALRDRPSLRWSSGARWWQPSLALDLA